MTAVAHLISLLQALGKRARDSKPDLSPAAAVLADLSRFAFAGGTRQVREVQAALARVRSQLDLGEHAAGTAATALVGPDSHAFLAGAFWALDEVLTARLDADSARRGAGASKTRRAEVRDLVIDELRQHASVSATGCASGPKGVVLAPRADELSRVFADLLREQIVEIQAGEIGEDRRTRYFTLTDVGRKQLDAVSQSSTGAAAGVRGVAGDV